MKSKRGDVGITVSKVTDKIKGYDQITGKLRDFKFVSERIIRDDDGNIIGVEKKWQ